MAKSVEVAGGALTALMAALASGCGFWMREPDLAPAAEYVTAAVGELRKGNVDEAEDILLRARARFPDDEVVLRWSAELNLMRWRDLAALDLLVELTRADELVTVTQRELNGQIGDLLFRSGKYGESAQYLRAGQTAAAEAQRKAKAFVTLGLPYIRREIEYAPISTQLFDEDWPAILCRVGAQDRVCVLDTGSSMSALAASVADEVGVTDQRDVGLVSDSLGRRHRAAIGVLPDLEIGKVQLGPLPVLILDDARMNLHGTSVDAPMGIIGLDILSRFRFVLDLADRRVRLDAPQGSVSRNSEPCLSVEGCLLFPVLLDGASMWFVLDTAASHSSLTTRGLADLPGGARRATPDFRSLKGLGSTFLSKKVANLVLQSSGVRFTGIELPVVDRVTDGVFPVHGVLGVDLLRYCRLTLDGHRLVLEQVQRDPK